MKGGSGVPSINSSPPPSVRHWVRNTKNFQEISHKRLTIITCIVQRAFRSCRDFIDCRAGPNTFNPEYNCHPVRQLL